MKVKRWHIWLGLVISAVFLYLALRKVDFRGVWQALRETQFLWLLPGLAIYFVGVLIRTWRWQYLLKPLKPVPIKTLFPIVNIGYMGNNVYPARAGEVLRSIVLKKREDVSISGSLATILVERIFDAVVILAFVILNLGQLAKMNLPDTIKQSLQQIALWVGLIFLVMLAIFVAIALMPVRAKKGWLWINERVIPKRFRKAAQGIGEKFLEGLASLRSPLDFFMVLLTTAAIWTCETGLYWSEMKAMGLSLSFTTLMLINGAINLVLLIPAAPGGLGTFDAACKTLLVAYGIEPEAALGYTLILRVALWVPITVLGAIYFIREGLKWNMDIKDYQADENTGKVKQEEAPDETQEGE